MSGWGGDWYPPRARKQPAPEHGIKIQKIGTTWWGVRWIEALEHLSSQYRGRLERGRTYARTGRTHDLMVKPGRVEAKVTGSSSEPYDITIEISALSDEAWAGAIAAMAQKAQFAAELLAGQMPKEIDEAFQASDSSLFPDDEDDLVTDCSCPDYSNPCKHVAATHYVLGDAIDRDPFLLFELRGRTRAQVLDALSAARGTGPKRAAAAPGIPKVKFGKVKPADYDQPRGALPTLQISFEAPASEGALLRALGSPAGWPAAASPAELLGPLIRAAAEKARRVALAEPQENEPKRK